MSQRTPPGPPPLPVVARVRVRYARRGRLRFASHRDFARSLERAVRRAGVPVAYSAGFSPHPRISYVGAAPMGSASEAEYLELALAAPVDPGWLRSALDAALPAGFDVLDCVPAGQGTGGLADRIDASAWRLELPGVRAADLRAAVAAFLSRDVVEVERLTRDGRLLVNARGAVVSVQVGAGGDPTSSSGVPPAGADGACAILDVVVRLATPAVRPDDVVAALRAVAGFEPPVPPRATRMAQGRLDDTGRLADPLLPDREALLADAVASPAEGGPGFGWPAAPSDGTNPAD